MMANSLVMALGIAIGKIAISITAAYAIVYFRFPGRELCFVLIFITLMMPVEVRIVPTFQVAANLNFIDSYLGLVLPLIASATATFLYRQMFMTIPAELLEAARIDGAGPWRFFVDVVLPLSRTNTAALFVVLFIYGWNQYLWPLLVTNQESMYTIVMGIQRMLRHGFRAVVHHVHHRDAPFARRSDIHHVVPRGDDPDAAQVRQGRQRVRIQAGFVGDQDLRAPAPLQHIFRIGAVIHRQIAERRQRVPRIVAGIQGIAVKNNDFHGTAPIVMFG